jgi:hypothetical protein
MRVLFALMPYLGSCFTPSRPALLLFKLSQRKVSLARVVPTEAALLV